MSNYNDGIYTQQTFGAEAWGVGRITDNPRVLTGLYALAAGASLFYGVGFLLPLIGLTAGNDLKAANSPPKPKDPKLVFKFSDLPKSLPSSATGAVDESDGEWEEYYVDENGNEIDAPVEPVKSAAVQTGTAPQVQAPTPAYDESTYGANPFGGSNTPKDRPVVTPNTGDGIGSKSKTLLNDWEEENKGQPTNQKDIDPSKGLGMLSDPTGLASQLIHLYDGKFLRSWFILGTTGDGKGVFMFFTLLLAVHKLGDRLAMYGLDPKCSKSEYGRWSIMPEENRYHFKAKGLKTKEDKARYEEGILSLIRKYEADPSPYKIFVIDELPAILRVLSDQAATMVLEFAYGIASMGRSEGEACFVMSNAVGMKENGMSESALSYFSLCYLSRKATYETLKSHRSYKASMTTDEMFAVTGRAAWLSTTGEWEPVPIEYNDLVEKIPYVTPPVNFGYGSFAKESVEESVMETRYLAEDLADLLDERGSQSALLMDLIKDTDYDDLEESAILSTIVPALKKYKHLVLLKKTVKGYKVSLPPTPKALSMFDLITS